MCEAELKRLQLFGKPKNEEEYSVNTSMITKRKYLNRIKGYPRLKSTSSSWPPLKLTWYPKVNMYYAFNEDTNPFTRVSNFAESVCNCSMNGKCEPHFPPPLDPFTERDPYSEDKARYKQLTTDPACFVVFGKPGLNSTRLAKMIADYWKCVLISPDTLIKEEIEAKTDKGRWMKQLLRCGRKIGPEIIMNLVEARVNGMDVMHRGYVVEGIPLIPNDPDLDYTAQSDSLQNLSNPDRLSAMFSDEGERETAETDGSLDSRLVEYDHDEPEPSDDELSERGEGYSSDSSRTYHLARNPFATESLRMILRDDYQWDIGNQIQEMFKSWLLKPSVIIYVICPDQDVLNRRRQFRLHPYTGDVIDTRLLQLHEERSRLSSPRSREVPNDPEMIELEEEIAAEVALVSNDLKKFLMPRATDLRANIETQCRIFERYALPCIDRQVLVHNPQYVIRVDGRTSAVRMFQVIRARLRTLPLPRVILPRRMSDVHETFADSDESTLSFTEDDLEGKTNEEAMEDLSRKNIVAPRFRWRLSPWQFVCPVALSKGQKIEGNAKHAVRFMNKLYFLSSDAAAEIFIENPRPFLLPPNPRPLCKILIYGPRYSGKSSLAEFLLHTYGGKVLNPRAIENREVNYRRRTLVRNAMDEVLEEVIKELTQNLEKQRGEREMVRMANLELWQREAEIIFDQLFRVLKSNAGEKKSDQGFEKIQGKIDQYNLTSLCSDPDLCERIANDKTKLMEFAPKNLLTMESPTRELDEDDPEVAAALDERIEEPHKVSVELDKDEISRLVAANINAAQTAPNTFGFTESGWVVDDMFPDIEMLEKVLERGIQVETVVVIREAEPYDYLINKWRERYSDRLAEALVNEKLLDDEDENEDHREVNFNKVMKQSKATIIGAASHEQLKRSVEIVLSKSSTATHLKHIQLEEYLDHLKQSEQRWDSIIEKVKEIGAGLIDARLPMEGNVEDYVKQQIDNCYSLGATVMTDEEKDREVEDANATATSLNEADFAEEDEETIQDLTASKDNRRLGDTGIFCPVALRRHNVLWKGKEEFSALYLDKIYTLSSEAALDAFVQRPREFVPYEKPVERIPLPRVSIVGPIGSGKSTLAKAISREFGLVHVDFAERLDYYMKDRAIPLVGRKHEDVFTPESELEEPLELPEDLEDQRYNCDRATIQAFVRQYLREGAVLPKRMLKECLLDFFQPPYNLTGLVFDNFPASAYDADAACDNFAVPEIVVELICSVEESQARIISQLYDSWKQKQDERKSVEELRFATEVREIEEKREKWISKKMKERRRLRRAQSLDTSNDEQAENEELSEKIEGRHDIDDISPLPTKSDSLVKESIELEGSDDSSTGEPDQKELREESLTRYEDPVKFEEWEDPDDARERIRQEVVEEYESGSQNLRNARAMFEERSIPWVEIDAEQDENSVLMSLMTIVDPLVSRNSSALERVYEVDLETAEKLLECGYYFQSSFGRCCPVQMYENKIPFQMYLPNEAAQQIYPVLHRQYVYFLGGKDALTAFLEHPLKYLEQDSCMPLIPARIAVIGPPKCGKTTIANRFARTYGMKAISREQVNQTNAHWQGGLTVLNDSLARLVEMQTIDSRSTCQGYVLDGFPENQSEVEEFAFLGIQPMMFIDLQADLEFCQGCSAADSKNLAKPPPFSTYYFSNQYEEWQVEAEEFRSWLKKFSQNVVTVDATAQKFAVWRRSNDEVCRRFGRIKKYFREADCDKAFSLTHMCVSPYEFRERQSKYESYCPVCLGQNDVLTFSGTPPSHEGMVQFRTHFYWLCDSHLDGFLADPLSILTAMKDVGLPEFRAEIIDQEIDVDHACWAKRLKVSGLCLVTYLDNLPRRSIVPGLNTLGVMYKDALYLFCSKECRDKFISQPTKYAEVQIHCRQSLPPVNLKTLPNLGFLEQTVATLIVQAVNKVAVLRAKLPGMTAEVTAAVYIGVYLKILNTGSDLNETAVYEEVLKRMDARRHLLQVALRNAKKMINPHVFFPPEDQRRNVVSKIRSTPSTPRFSFPPIQVIPEEPRRVPVPDARFDYLCEYFKPLSKVPGFLNVVDIAGLVKGAAEGQGLGNAFLSHISACDAIFHLCRAFEDDDVTHIEGEVNPVRDFDIISEELRLKDIEFLNAHLEKLEKLVVRGNDKKLKPEYETLLKVKTILVDEKRHIRFADWSANDIEVLNKYLFLTSKPVIYLVNLSEKDYIRKKNKWLIKIKEWVDKNDPGAILIPFSGIFENKVLDMDDAERAKYFEESKVTSALDKIIVQGYKALQLQYFFTAGADEVKAWTIPKGAKAPQAAGRIHTDFEKGFIMAEVMKFDDFKSEGSESAVKAAGKYRQQGRNYVVEDGDIIFFKFNAGAGLKDAKKK